MAAASGTLLDDIAGNFGKVTRESVEQLGAIGIFFFQGK